jgi:hypothetical protein
VIERLFRVNVRRSLFRSLHPTTSDTRAVFIESGAMDATLDRRGTAWILARDKLIRVPMKGSPVLTSCITDCQMRSKRFSVAQSDAGRQIYTDGFVANTRHRAILRVAHGVPLSGRVPRPGLFFLHLRIRLHSRTPSQAACGTRDRDLGLDAFESPSVVAGH